MNIKIREASKADARGIAALAREIWTEHYVPISGKAHVDYMLNKFQSEAAVSKDIGDGFRYYVAEDKNKLVGYLAVCPKSDCLFLSKLYVLKEYRGNGIARRFFDIAKEVCQSLKLDKICLTVNKRNASSIAVYKKLGFVIESEMKKDIGDGFFMDDYAMECIIQRIGKV